MWHRSLRFREICIATELRNHSRRQSDDIPKSIAESVSGTLQFVEGNFLGLAEAMPEDKYSFIPTVGKFDGVRSFGEQVKHVACAQFAFFNEFEGNKPPDDCEKGGHDPAKTKAELIKYLKDSFDYSNRVLATLTAKNALDRIEGRYGGPNTKLGISVIAVRRVNRRRWVRGKSGWPKRYSWRRLLSKCTPLFLSRDSYQTTRIERVDRLSGAVQDYVLRSLSQESGGLKPRGGATIPTICRRGVRVRAPRQQISPLLGRCRRLSLLTMMAPRPSGSSSHTTRFSRCWHGSCSSVNSRKSCHLIFGTQILHCRDRSSLPEFGGFSLDSQSTDHG